MMDENAPINPMMAVDFLRASAQSWEQRASDSQEDSEHWACRRNAVNCKRTIKLIEQLTIPAHVRENTGFKDRTGKELFLGDIVRHQIEAPFQEMHGTWGDYEIVKGAGGYVLAYFRSEKGCVLPFGYTACFMNDFRLGEEYDLKQLIWSREPITHPALIHVECSMSPEDRRELFVVESRQRREEQKKVLS